jgi:hypothetical protein
MPQTSGQLTLHGHPEYQYNLFRYLCKGYQGNLIEVPGQCACVIMQGHAIGCALLKHVEVLIFSADVLLCCTCAQGNCTREMGGREETILFQNLIM